MAKHYRHKNSRGMNARAEQVNADVAQSLQTPVTYAISTESKDPGVPYLMKKVLAPSLAISYGAHVRLDGETRTLTIHSPRTIDNLVGILERFRKHGLRKYGISVVSGE